MSGGQQAPVWRTRTGRKISVADMTTGHLQNALRMLVRTAEHLDALALSAFVYAMDAPDGASDAAESEADMMMRKAEDCRRWVAAFERELARRKEAKQ